MKDVVNPAASFAWAFVVVNSAPVLPAHPPQIPVVSMFGDAGELTAPDANVLGVLIAASESCQMFLDLVNDPAPAAWGAGFIQFRYVVISQQIAAIRDRRILYQILVLAQISDP